MMAWRRWSRSYLILLALVLVLISWRNRCLWWSGDCGGGGDDGTSVFGLLHREKRYCLVESAVFNDRINQFQKVEVPGDSQLFVYSASYDRRAAGDGIRIIAVGKHNHPQPWRPQKLSCVVFSNVTSSGLPNRLQSSLLWDGVTRGIDLGPIQKTIRPLVSINGMWWNHLQSIEAVCPGIPTMADGNQWFVSVVSDNEISSEVRCAQNLLPITVVQIREQRELFGVCVQPLHYFNDTFKLVEFIEFNKLFGAQHFYFYSLSVSKAVGDVLEYYVSQNTVTLLPWQIPTPAMLEGHVGQMAALADCQIRVMQKFVYMVYIDLDELIVPRSNKTWVDIHRDIFQKQPCSQAIFANVYFFTNQTDDISAAADADIRQFHLTTMLKTERFVHPLPFNDRTKVIARADCIKRHAIHFVDSLLPIAECRNLNTANVPMDIGFLHHYRCCEGSEGLNLPADRSKVRDYYLHNTFKPRLVDHVRKTLADLKMQ